MTPGEIRDLHAIAGTMLGAGAVLSLWAFFAWLEGLVREALDDAGDDDAEPDHEAAP